MITSVEKTNLALSEVPFENSGDLEKTKDLEVSLDEFVETPKDLPKNAHLITGRSPSSGIGTGTLSSMGIQIGSATQIFAAGILKEYGYDHLSEIVSKGKTKIDLPLSTALSVCFKRQQYALGDKYIRKDDLRKECDQAFLDLNQDITWVESEGVTEVGGGGKKGTLPLGALGNGKGEIGLKGLIKYRCLEPYETITGEVKNEDLILNSAQIPINAIIAKKMAPGSEFEICGEGKFNLSMGVKNIVDLGLSGDLSSELSIKVQRLLPKEDQPNLVMVRFAFANKGHVDGHVDVGGSVDLSSYVKEMPKVGDGVLKYFVEQANVSTIYESLKEPIELAASYKMQHEQKKQDVTQIVFDLSDKDAAQAYNEMFSHFSLKKAKELAGNNKGVKIQTLGDYNSLSDSSFTGTLGTSKVISNRSVNQDRTGHFKFYSDDLVEFKEKKTIREYYDWFNGGQSVSWETVDVRKEKKSESQTYYRLSFVNHDHITTEEEVNSFLYLAKSLGVDLGGNQVKLPAISELAEVFSSQGDSEVNIDVYFTPQGVKKLKKVSAEEIENAYLKVNAQFDPNGKGLPFAINKSDKVYELAKEYQVLNNQWFFMRWFSGAQMSQIADTYAEVTGGRPILPDVAALDEISALQTSILEAQKGEEVQVDRLFTTLGQSYGFSFMKVLALLKHLVGEEHTLVHEYSMKGGGVNLAIATEGEVIHPEREVLSDLAKSV